MDTNKELFGLFCSLGKHTLKLNEQIVFLLDSQNLLIRMLSVRLPDLSAEERETLRTLASRRETYLEQVEAASKAIDTSLQRLCSQL
jgi:shikimate kinase